MKHWLPNLINRYDTAIWIRVIGTILTTFSNFMLRPFLGFFLYDKLDGNLLLSALVVSLQPLSSMICSLYSGGLADKYGRKPIMMVSLLIESVTMLGYVWADSIYTFAVLTILNGIGASLFWPAASAQVTDVVPEEKRSEVFALLHTALNIGAAAGPLIGVAIYKVNPDIAFALCAATLFCYSLLILWKVPETLPKENRLLSPNVSEPQPQPRLKIREHRHLFLITLAALPVSLLYSQSEMILPQHLRTHFPDFLEVFATMLTINGCMVVALQMVVAKLGDRFPTKRVILAAYLCFACVGFGYGWAPSFLLLILAEIVFTLGEMLYGPQIQKAVSVLAPAEFRGRYFSIFGSNWAITGTIGPSIGAFALTHIGGAYWYSIVGLLLIVAGLFQYRLVSKITSRSPLTLSEPPIPSSTNEPA
ncbi:MDR family MFS transporter [Brevibacillus fulvus]|uniref:MFS family permease n=1 Tax=Brevibacillus fulvus TaxID=1125967 RepID=A0A938XSZ8_9BACL|nr:MFS transporter [Brevibacillus fulvus]MBM7589447.1 MFS family permease [Brevibacillus fulvus]